jgi:anti-sigma regulatory factor (Ser/Thr protein kinase)
MVHILSRPSEAPPNNPPSEAPIHGGWEVVADRTAARPHLLRKIARTHLELCGLADSSAMDTVPLLLTELVTNAIRHGGGEAGVEVDFRHGQIRIAVTDGGTGIPELRPPDIESESGRGLFLVDRLADSWGVSPDGATTWCAVTVPSSC